MKKFMELAFSSPLIHSLTPAALTRFICTTCASLAQLFLQNPSL
jgi:hypothetical protein